MRFVYTPSLAFPCSHSTHHGDTTQPESERLDLQYELLKVLFGMRDYFAPLHDPRKILDIGTGTGKWAIEMGMLLKPTRGFGRDCFLY